MILADAGHTIGNAICSSALAYCLRNGLGIAQDTNRADELLQFARANGIDEHGRPVRVDEPEPTNSTRSVPSPDHGQSACSAALAHSVLLPVVSLAEKAAEEASLELSLTMPLLPSPPAPSAATP